MSLYEVPALFTFHSLSRPPRHHRRIFIDYLSDQEREDKVVSRTMSEKDVSRVHAIDVYRELDSIGII